MTAYQSLNHLMRNVWVFIEISDLLLQFLVSRQIWAQFEILLRYYETLISYSYNIVLLFTNIWPLNATINQ